MLCIIIRTYTLLDWDSWVGLRTPFILWQQTSIGRHHARALDRLIVSRPRFQMRSKARGVCPSLDTTWQQITTPSSTFPSNQLCRLVSDGWSCPVIIYVFSFLTQINDDLCTDYLNICLRASIVQVPVGSEIVTSNLSDGGKGKCMRQREGRRPCKADPLIRCVGPEKRRRALELKFGPGLDWRITFHLYLTIII
jgi:hypothetical protein